MSRLGEILADYGAARGELTSSAGASQQAEGAGGELAAVVERRGVGPLAASLSTGERLLLVDSGVELQLERQGAVALLRVSWEGGPSYEERIAVRPGGAAPFAGGASESSSTAGGVAALGAASFLQAHGVRAAYIAGAMAGGIASAELVVAMGREGLLSFFGSGGLALAAVEEAIAHVQRELSATQPYGFNLLHNPVEPKVEAETVDLYLARGVHRVSASAFMTLTPAIVRYRLTGITRDSSGIVCPNHVFAKVSRPEVAERFMRPAPGALIEALVADGVLTPEQGEWAAMVPVANDVTVEADSGGHTDRRPLTVVLPCILRLRDRISAELGYAERRVGIRVGAAGGLGEPSALHAAFCMGADYVLTGSVNQATVEAGTSDIVKQMLADAGVADCASGPAPDMFEIGANVQVLSRGSMYAQRAQRLYDLYRRHQALDEIPEADRNKIERFFACSSDEVWTQTRAYWAERDPAQVTKAESDPHHKMALVFRWYLGMTSRWARTGDVERKRDFQIWCGPAMGAFNDWARGTPLEALSARTVTAVAWALLEGAAALA